MGHIRMRRSSPAWPDAVTNIPSRGLARLCTHSLPRVVNPELRRHQVRGKPKPKRDSEKLVRRQVREPLRGEEGADDGPDGGDGEPQRERANHPFAMASHLSSTDAHEGATQRNQEHDAK